MLASPLPHSLLRLPKGLFEPVAVARAVDRSPDGGATPLLLKGVAAEWPATLLWSFEYLAKIGGPQAVRLVVGNRENGRTAFIRSALDDYLLALHRGGASPGEPVPCLKEFDLLRQMPLLRGDVRPDELFSRHHMVSNSAWIGPAGAHTGLHHDHLDNLAVLLRGRKRFFLARPGTIESLGGVSEQAHQRAHRLYNDRLARSGAPALVLEQRIESAVRELSHLDLDTRLAMSAAFEHLTALLSAEVLRGSVWVTATPCRESRLWRWHCEEEIAHCHVTADLLRAGKVGYLRRTGSLALATCFLGIDLARLVFALCAHDVRCGAARRGRLLLQAAGFAWRTFPGVLRMAAGGLGYLVPMHR